MAEPGARVEAQRGAETFEVGALDRDAIRVVWRELWRSRLVVWVAGVAALALFGWPEGTAARLDPLYFTTPFDSNLLNHLVAPAARWDAAHYLEIATFGYKDPSTPAFFPAYPLLIAAGGGGTGSLLLGVLLSVTFAFGALFLLYRLVAIDFGSRVAAATVAIVAWYPSSLVLSAVYTDSLFLLVSVAAILAARQGNWVAAGLLGAMAAATRSSGVLLMVPLAWMYLFGPRSDSEPGRFRFGLRYRVRADVAWIALVPAGLLAYMAFLGADHGDSFALFTSQEEWERIAAPLGGVVLAVWSAIQGLAQFVPGVGPESVLTPAGGYPAGVGLRNVILLGFLALAGWLLVESWRRLPHAYTLYAAAGMALPLSVPALDEPLKSFPRFLLVLFPLWIALALWALERDRLREVVGVFAVLLVVFSGLFTTWVQAP